MTETREVTITNAGLGDVGTLRKLEQDCFGKDAWPLLDLIGVLTFPGVVRLKAMLGDTMVGFVSGDPRPRENVGWITSICVHPDHQGQGIGTRLLKACEQKMGMERVKLCVRRSNETAIKMYLKHGYSQVNVWPRYYLDKEDGLILEKNI